MRVVVTIMAHLVIYVEEALARAVELLLGSGFDVWCPDWAPGPDWKPGRGWTGQGWTRPRFVP
jgi:hypothetical protein